MLSMLKDVKGEVIINGEKYDSVKTALNTFHSDSDIITITFIRNHRERNRERVRASQSNTLKKITVKQYMTRKTTFRAQ